MLEFAKEKVDNADLPNVTFQTMDGMDLQVGDNTMDRAACSFGLMLFPDRHKGFTELGRVLRPGGKAMVSGWAGPDKFEGFAIFLNAIQRAFPDFPNPDSPPTCILLSRFRKFQTAGGSREV
ncbi:MAG: class I SAM-dependent methyltransferase [Cyclobacterium sp.]|nr:class I SAM-dependent methyltransferase [Cyclobacterium sp.]